MIQKERLLKEFQHLVSFDSESYEERDIADYLKEKLIHLGLEVTEDNAGSILQKKSGVDNAHITGNLYAFLKGTATGEPILLSSHMDTVKPGKGKKAIFHEDGRITSAGDTVLGADDAAGIAAILEALQVVLENNLPHPDIEILFPVAEEPYAQGSRLFDYNKIHSKLAYVLDLSGSVGTAAVAAPSIISIEIRVHGKNAHAGFCPEAGVHAISIAAKAIAQIPNGHVDSDTTVNLGTIQGGIAKNIVPDSCVILGEIRSMKAEKAQRQMDFIQESFEKEAKLAGGSVEVNFTKEFEAYRIAPEEEVVQRFFRACDKLGLEKNLVDTFGGSDNNHFTAHGIRGIVLANAMNEVHTTKEYTTIDELLRSTQVTLELITNSSIAI